MKKNSVIFVGVLLIMCSISLIIGCSQPTDLVEMPVPIPEPTIEDIARKAVEDSIKELEIDTSVYTEEYARNYADSYYFSHFRLYLTRDNSQIITAHTSIQNGNVYDIEDGKIASKLYSDTIVAQDVLQGDANVISLDAIAVVDNDGTVLDTRDCVLLQITYDENVRDLEGTTTNLGSWTERAGETYMIIKRTGSDVVLENNVTKNSETEYEISNYNLLFYKNDPEFPLDYKPSDSVLNEGIEEVLTSHDTDVSAFDTYYTRDEYDGENAGIEVERTRIYFDASSQEMTKVTTLIENGSFDNMNIESETQDIFSNENTFQSLVTGTLVENLGDLSLTENGITQNIDKENFKWYTFTYDSKTKRYGENNWDTNTDTEYLLLKVENGVLYMSDSVKDNGAIDTPLRMYEYK